MNILIAHIHPIPVNQYGGTERVIWYLGKELKKLGHQVSYLVPRGSYCDFARVLVIDPSKTLNEQIPNEINLVHFQYEPNEEITKPHVITIHCNGHGTEELDRNTIFVSRNHAQRFGSKCFVYNGLDWDDYGKPNLNNQRDYFHFLGKAAWRVKNVKGAIQVIRQSPHEKLKVLGGHRLNIKMGFRFTLSPRIRFYGMVGGAEKNRLIAGSKGLIFPVRWHEPFGLAIIESLYFGCPVFGTPYGSLSELVIPEVGVLSNQSRVLAQALQETPQFSRKICHEYALSNFNAKRMAEQYVEKYERVLNGEKLNAYPPKLIEKQSERFLAWN